MQRRARLTAKKQRTILALLTESTIQRAAEVSGVNPATVWRWQKDPAFRKALREARHQAVSGAIARLQQASTEAVDILRELMTGRRIRPGTRLQAVRTTLEFAVRGIEIEQLEAKLDELETRLNRPGNRRLHAVA